MSTPQPRKKRRFLAPQEKFEIWMQLVRGEITIGDAADKNRVDRATISSLRDVAQNGALEALASSRPGWRGPSRDHELDDAKAEVNRLRMALAEMALAEMAVKLTLAEGKEPWG